MAKLSDMAKIENPLNGTKGNVLDLSFWIQNILGVGFIFAVFAMGQMLIGKITGVMPFGIKTAGTSLVSMPNTADTNVQPQRMVF